MFAWSLLDFSAIPVLISADKLGKMFTVIEVCLKLSYSKLKQDRDDCAQKFHKKVMFFKHDRTAFDFTNRKKAKLLKIAHIMFLLI
jgi:hypothetical protein